MTISQADELKPCTAESPEHGNFHLFGALSPSFSRLQLPLASSTCSPSPPTHPLLCPVNLGVPVTGLQALQDEATLLFTPSHFSASLSALLLRCNSSHSGVRSNFTFSPPMCPRMPVKGRKWGWGRLRKRRREARRVKDRPAMLMELSDSLFTEKPKSL